VSHFLSPIFAAGFFESEAVAIAIGVGAIVAIVAGVVGVFTVVRGQSFAGHAFGDVGTTGGSAAYLVAVGPLWGFVLASLIGAGAMEIVGVQRRRGRDIATGIVLGATLGLAALFLHFTTTSQSTTGATVTILFGSLFAVSSTTVPLIVLLSAIVLAITLTIYRPLLLSSVSAEMASARGIPIRLIGGLYLLALGLAVALAAFTIGTILSTALVVGPAASALRLTKRPLTALLAAAGIGVGATWLGIVLAYDSFHWPPQGQGWPVSFFVVTLVFIAYLLSGLPEDRRRRQADRTPPAPPDRTPPAPPDRTPPAPPDRTPPAPPDRTPPSSPFAQPARLS
jgi:zinc/manganese transport system permease protein